MLDWLRRRHAYTFRTVVYEREETWVAHAADPKLSGFGESKAQALADVRAMLESYVESLRGAHCIPVKRPVKTDEELRELGDLVVVEIPNPHERPRRLMWPSWLPGLRDVRS